MIITLRRFTRRTFVKGYGLWLRINEPRMISVYYAVAYVVIGAFGFISLWNPPSSLQGAVGSAAMYCFLGLMAAGGFLGAPVALNGKYWLERWAIGFLVGASLIYLGILFGLHVGSPGNRLPQMGFIFFFLMMQGVRIERVRKRDYRSSVLPEV